VEAKCLHSTQTVGLLGSGRSADQLLGDTKPAYNTEQIDPSACFQFHRTGATRSRR